MVFSQPLRGRSHAPIPLFARGTNMQNLVIVGTGLIGSSFGLALRQAGFTGAITGVSSPHAIAEALSRGAIDRGASLEEAIPEADLDRKSTRLNSSHLGISYAVFCLKKKKKHHNLNTTDGNRVTQNYRKGTRLTR